MKFTWFIRSQINTLLTASKPTQHANEMNASKVPKMTTVTSTEFGSHGLQNVKR